MTEPPRIVIVEKARITSLEQLEPAQVNVTQAMYEAFRENAEAPLPPTWDELPDRVKCDWCAAADALRHTMSCVLVSRGVFIDAEGEKLEQDEAVSEHLNKLVVIFAKLPLPQLLSGNYPPEIVPLIEAHTEALLARGHSRDTIARVVTGKVQKKGRS